MRLKKLLLIFAKYLSTVCAFYNMYEMYGLTGFLSIGMQTNGLPYGFDKITSSSEDFEVQLKTVKLILQCG